MDKPVPKIENKEHFIESLSKAHSEVFLKYLDHVNASRYLHKFELDMRNGCSSEMLTQSNSQKMQLVLERYIALNPDNWTKWQRLKDKERETHLQFTSAESYLHFLQDCQKGYPF